MRDLWAIFGQIDNCLVVAVGLICCGCGAWAGWILSLNKQTNTKLTNSQYAQMVFCLFFGFLSGVLALGIIMAPDNAMKLMELMRIKRLLYDFARLVQQAIMWVLRLFL